MAVALVNIGVPLVNGQYQLPAWCNVALEPPQIPPQIHTPDGAKAIVETIYDETLRKHRILESFQGLDAKFAMDLIHIMCERAVNQFAKGNTVKAGGIFDWFELCQDVAELEKYSIDNPIRLACESVILNLFCRFVKHHMWIATPTDFLRAHNFFEKERSYWWRKQIAKPTAEHNREKYEKLMLDIPALLQYYNSVLHVRDLNPKQTLKHTVTLCSLTVEGRSYENGQGRSISSECRHIIVRTLCDIPIKPRPPRIVGTGAVLATSGKSKDLGVASSKKRKTDPLPITFGAGASAGASAGATPGVAPGFSIGIGMPYSSTAYAVPQLPKIVRLHTGVDSIAKVPLGRLTSTDWPKELGFQDSDPPKLSEDEQLIFSQTAEKLLMLSSSRVNVHDFLLGPPSGAALHQASQDEFDMVSTRNLASLGPTLRETNDA